MPSCCFYPRSALFVPAANARAMAKTGGLAMDTVIFDLEDSVSENTKSAARENLSAFFKAHATAAFFRVIRINALSHPEGTADLELVRRLKPDAILLPKAEEPETINRVMDMLRLPEKTRPALWVMIETPKGILHAAAIAAHPAVTTLVVGPNDIVAATDIAAGKDRQNLLPWLMQIVLAAKASQCCVLDGVYNDFRDVQGFAEECGQAAHMGFDGKALIHPGQIKAANAAFLPSEETITNARAIVAAFREPQNAEKGVISLNGQMVERLHLSKAQKLLQKRGQIREKEAT